MGTAISIHIGTQVYDATAYGRPISGAPAYEFDATAMAELAKREGLAATTVLGTAATKAAVEDALTKAADTLKAGDFLLVTFSGHGKRLTDDGGDAADEDDGYDESWCLYDGPMRDDDIYRLLQRFVAGVRILVLSDSCYSGTVLRKEDDVRASVVLLAACSDDQVTMTTEVRGRFTDAVLDVWRGGAFTGDLAAFCKAVAHVTKQKAQKSNYGPLDTFFESSRPFTVSPVAVPFVPPLKVHLCWFDGPRADPRCAVIAREIYEFLHRPTDDDPVLRPGLEIPVEYGRDLKGLLEALERPEHHPDREPDVLARVVVLILDRGAYGRPPHRAAVTEAVKRWTPTDDAPGDGSPATAPRTVLLPIVLHGAWHGELGGLDEMLPAVNHTDISDDADRRWRLPSDVAVVAGRALLAAVRASREESSDASKEATPRVLISHAAADGLPLARSLASHLKNHTRIGAWLDHTDVRLGEELVRQLDKAAGQGVVLVIRTDRYSESPWCGLELLRAKQHQVPMLTLFDGRDGEVVTSAYGGNHRTMYWAAGREWQIVGRCVQAWLHGHHFAAHAAAAASHAGLGEAIVITRRPELLDVCAPHVRSERRIVMYPDPPLLEGEAQLLRDAQPALRLTTPSTALGRVMLNNDPQPPLAGRSLALSLSHAEELPDLESGRRADGLTQEHLEDVIHTIVLATLHTGARIAYGGDFRKHRGYASKLSELHRSRRRLGTGSRSQLVAFVDAAGARAGDGNVEFEAKSVDDLPGTERYPQPVRDVLWHLAMRHAMAKECDARVLLGGKVRALQQPGDGGYTSPWPGLLEEAWRTLEARKALYVIGAFGGAAGAVAEMLVADRVPPSLSIASHAGAPLAQLDADSAVARLALAKQGVAHDVLMIAKDGTPRGMDRLASEVLEHWRRFRAGDASAWDNGLNVAENHRLFRSTDRTEIAHLIFNGMRNVARAKAAGVLELSFYRGDIAAVSGVDGYAVTVTPGLRSTGAFAAIDQAMSGRLSAKYGQRVRQAVDEVKMPDVAPIDVETSTLSGWKALVSRLGLPIDADDAIAKIKALAIEIAAVADRLGLSSIAVAPFAASFGLPADRAMRALLEGLTTDKRDWPRSVVICEVDRGRYESMRSAAEKLEPASLGGGRRLGTVRELRAGPRPLPLAENLVLQAEGQPVAGATAETGPVTLTITAWVPDQGRGMVPRHTFLLDEPMWRSLRTRPVTFESSIARGAVLRDLLLSNTTMARLIRDHDERRAVLLVNEVASGLPWEAIAEPGGILARGLVRTATAAGSIGAPRDPAFHDPRLRVLLVVNPRGDLGGADLEGDAVERALTSRPDIEVTRLNREEASRDAVSTALAGGRYDILHYAGHAYFDPASPGKSGLKLAGNEELYAEDIIKAGSAESGVSSDAKPGGLPRLVVLSACTSARLRDVDGIALVPQAIPVTPPGEVSLAEAWLRAGVTLVGTFFPVADNAALIFGSELHRALAEGRSIGDAVRVARRELHEQKVADWANFILYGDDSLTL